jgi:flagellar basal body-associated protein FliL
MQVQPPPMQGYPAQQPQAQDWGAQQPYSTTEPAGSGKMIIAVVVGVLLLAAAGVGSYFLFFNKGAAAGNTNSQTNQSAVAGNTNSPSTTNMNTTTTTTTTTSSGGNLSGVVNTLLQAMKDGNTSALRSNIARNASANADSIINDIRAKGAMTSYKLTSEPAAFEDRGVAFFTFDWGGGNQSTGLMNLVKEDGAWKLDSFVMF